MDRTKEISELFDQRKQLFLSKNANYGNSYQKTGVVLNMMAGHEIRLATTKEHILYGLLTRMADKMMRLVQLLFCGEIDKVGESAIDTAGDLGTYSFILTDEIGRT